MKTFFREEDMCLTATACHRSLAGLSKAPDVLDRVVQNQGVVGGLVTEFAPATMHELCYAHDGGLVRGVFTGTKQNGYGSTSQAIAKQAAWNAGAMMAATRYVLGENRATPMACVPASGFHHAHYAHAGGYCTFNALMVAILHAARAGALGESGRALIIDGDGHYGDGTQDIINTLNMRERVINMSGPRLMEPSWYGNIERSLEERPALVLYQAGADAHKDDPYGVGYLDDEEFFARDVLVFNTCAKYRIPLVWCFAGGYNGEKTVELHAQSFQTATRASHRAALAVLKPVNEV